MHHSHNNIVIDLAICQTPMTKPMTKPMTCVNKIRSIIFKHVGQGINQYFSGFLLTHINHVEIFMIHHTLANLQLKIENLCPSRIFSTIHHHST